MHMIKIGDLYLSDFGGDMFTSSQCDARRFATQDDAKDAIKLLRLRTVMLTTRKHDMADDPTDDSATV